MSGVQNMVFKSTHPDIEVGDIVIDGNRTGKVVERLHNVGHSDDWLIEFTDGNRGAYTQTWVHRHLQKGKS